MVFWSFRQDIIWAVLLCDGFQIQDFIFLRVISFPGVQGYHDLFRCWFTQNWRLFSNFSVACRLLGSKMLPTNQNHSFPFPLPNRITPPDWPWPLFVCRFNRLQSAGRNSWFTISPHHFNGRSLPSHHNNLSYRLLIYERAGQGYWSPLHPLYILPRHNIYIYIYIYIMSCHQHGYPWPSLATPPYRSSLLVGPQGYILYPHRAAVCWFELIALLLLGYVRGSIGEHHLWARSCFSTSILHVWFV